MEEQDLIQEAQEQPSLINTMQIETGSGGYHISALIEALMPESDFETIVTRITYIERRLRAVKDMPPLHGPDDEPTGLSAEG